MEDIKNIEKSIQYSGFGEIDSASMSIVKKAAEGHTRKIKEHAKKVELMKLTLKAVHKKEKSEMYEVHVYIIDNGKKYASETTNRNLLAAVDDALNKIIKEITSRERK